MVKPLRLRSQLGQFGIVPLWVLTRVMGATQGVQKDGDFAARAVHAYAMLAAKYADRDHLAYPKRETLAKQLGVSVVSVMRALKVLRTVGAIQTRRRRRADGAVVGLEYLLVQIEPEMEQPLQFQPEPKDAESHQFQPEPKAESHQFQPEPSISSSQNSIYKGLTRSIEPDPLVQGLRPDPSAPTTETARRVRPVADDHEPTFAILVKVAHEAIDIEGEHAALATLADAVKSLCRIRELAVGDTGARVHKAIDAALWQRKGQRA